MQIPHYILFFILFLCSGIAAYANADSVCVKNASSEKGIYIDPQTKTATLAEAEKVKILQDSTTMYVSGGEFHISDEAVTNATIVFTNKETSKKAAAIAHVKKIKKAIVKKESDISEKTDKISSPFSKSDSKNSKSQNLVSFSVSSFTVLKTNYGKALSYVSINRFNFEAPTKSKENKNHETYGNTKSQQFICSHEVFSRPPPVEFFL